MKFKWLFLLALITGCTVNSYQNPEPYNPEYLYLQKFENLDKGILKGQIIDILDDKILVDKNFRVTARTDSAYSDWIEFYHFKDGKLISAGLEYSLEKMSQEMNVNDFVQLQYIYEQTFAQISKFYGKPHRKLFSYYHRFYEDISAEYYKGAAVMKLNIPQKVPARYFITPRLRRLGVNRVTVRIIGGFAESFVRICFIYD
ncbi:MAG TPA: hypothetical protein DHM37_07535 [Candidatus Cloacimonas sp.]|jgi:hypothetical protein|nr:hypothetical protein [Candidatus Cloacimonas sp.]